MNCKDCIHEKVCVIIAFPEAFQNTKWENAPCDHCTNKADYVEVVRCKECRNFKSISGATCCTRYGIAVQEDCFCSQAERKM